jgi:hypothetical protein
MTTKEFNSVYENKCLIVCSQHELGNGGIAKKTAGFRDAGRREDFKRGNLF